MLNANTHTHSQPTWGCHIPCRVACGKPQKTAVSRGETEGQESQLRVGKVVNKSTDLRPENLSACVTGRNERGKGEREREGKSETDRLV